MLSVACWPENEILMGAVLSELFPLQSWVFISPDQTTLIQRCSCSLARLEGLPLEPTSLLSGETQLQKSALCVLPALQIEASYFRIA